MIPIRINFESSRQTNPQVHTLWAALTAMNKVIETTRIPNLSQKKYLLVFICFSDQLKIRNV